MPTEEIFLFEKHTTQGSQKFVALSAAALQSGVLSALTGDQLALFLLLLSLTSNARKGLVTNDQLETLLSGNRKKNLQNLKELEKIGAVSVEEAGEYFSYDINLEFLKGTEKSAQSLELEERFLRELLSERPVSEQELVKGLVMILAPEKLTERLRGEIEEIMTTFSPDIVKELIRRVKKALEDNPDLKPLPYLRAIVREWMKEGITSYEDLQKADRLHRETFELATEFGLQRARELTPSHKKLMASWITARDTEDFALSIEIARWAIQEAIRRKRDGRPSLDYIHRNFILPLKKERVSTIEEAQEALQGKRSDSDEEEQPTLDYERFRND